MRILLKIFLATGMIYYGYESYAQLMSGGKKDCLGWVCSSVQCPDGYAVWIPEKQAFLPCEKFDDYIMTKDLGLLR